MRKRATMLEDATNSIRLMTSWLVSCSRKRKVDRMSMPHSAVAMVRIRWLTTEAATFPMSSPEFLDIR